MTPGPCPDVVSAIEVVTAYAQERERRVRRTPAGSRLPDDPSPTEVVAA